MAEIQEIDLVIGPDGQVTFEVRGVGGPKCEDLTKELEAILGGNILSRDFKASYHQQVARQDQTISQTD